jgi:UDP-N-acetylglucosamine 2-epimerase (non-hydrolysing)
LFCPTQTAVDNLKREGITDGVYLTGDVMVDVLNSNIEIAERSDILDRLQLTSKRYLVVTLHRAGNTDVTQNLEILANALVQLSELGETIVFPVHPRTEKLLKNCGLYDRLNEKIKLVEPLGYFEFLKLLSHAKRVLTDSGGIQKEACILKVLCITLRENTEWMETVESGWNVLAGTNIEGIIKLARNFEPTQHQSDIFGQGACQKIVKILFEVN